MKKNYFVIICSIVLLILFGMIAKLGIALKQQSIKDDNSNVVIIKKEETTKNTIKKYSIVSKTLGNILISKPEFDNSILDEYIDNYIVSNVCNNLIFNIDYLTNDLINLKLECNNNKETNLYDLKQSKFINFKELIKDEEVFKDRVYNLLCLKYPIFVAKEVDIINSDYIINNNEIILTYNTLNYGMVNIKINNNEIEELLNYNMKYDKVYENEKYVLDPNKKTIAFTFDDGPSEYDLEIINALKESHSTATFFVVGSRINNYQRSIFSMIENKMEVGNHTYSHKSLKKISDSEALYQINETNNIYKSLTNEEIHLLRPPYGAYKDNISSFNMPIIMWNIDTLDWQVRNTDKVYNHILNNISDGDIILMHSLFDTTKNAVIKVLPELYKRGYQVVSVTELASLKGINLESGKVYHSFIK